MKKFLLLGLFAFFSVAALRAQTGQLAIQLQYPGSASDPSAQGLVQVYRASGTACTPPLANFTQVTATAPPVGPYVDATVVAGGTYSYYVTATVPGFNGASAPSNCITVSVVSSQAPLPPTGLTATVVVVNSNGTTTPALAKPKN